MPSLELDIVNQITLIIENIKNFIISLDFDVIFQPNNFIRLLQGFCVTIKIAIISLFFSLFLGTLAGSLMLSHNKIIKIIMKFFLEIAKYIPLVVMLYILFFGLPYFGIDTDAMVVGLVVFTFWGTLEMGDIIKGAITAIPKHQKESSQALGMTSVQTYRYVLLPQTIRMLSPAVVNLATRMIKATSILSMIGVIEIIEVGQSIINYTYMVDPNSNIAFSMYFVILMMYFFVCYPLSLLAKYLEKRYA